MATNLDDLRRLREAALAAGPGTGPWIKAAQALMDQFPAYYATALAMNERNAQTRGALSFCLNAMLRMIPGYLEHTGEVQCTHTQHDQAICAAATVLYGADRARWPVGVQAAAEGRYQ